MELGLPGERGAGWPHAEPEPEAALEPEAEPELYVEDLDV
jgi:hypothetical protein